MVPSSAHTIRTIPTWGLARVSSVVASLGPLVPLGPLGRWRFGARVSSDIIVFFFAFFVFSFFRFFDFSISFSGLGFCFGFEVPLEPGHPKNRT